MAHRLRRFARKPLAEKLASLRALASRTLPDPAVLPRLAGRLVPDTAGMRAWARRAAAGSAEARLRLGMRMGDGWFPPRVLRRNGDFYLAYRPDWDREHHQVPELAALSRPWVAGNRTNNAGDLPRLYAMILNLRQAMGEGVAGDMAELGVYRGNSAAVLAHYARAHGRRLHLFDTFEGFDRRDLRGVDSEVRMQFGDAGLAEVQRLVGMRDVAWIKGYFPQSVPDALKATRYSVVHLDCDLHDPMKAGLEYFYPRLSPGGLLIIHDYSSRHWDGVKQAVDAFAADIPESLVLQPDKSGTAMLRKARASPGQTTAAR